MRVLELFELPRTIVICVLAMTTLSLMAMFGLVQFKLVLGLVAGVILFAFAMDSVASFLVRIMCDLARETGRGLGCLVAAFQDR